MQAMQRRRVENLLTLRVNQAVAVEAPIAFALHSPRFSRRFHSAIRIRTPHLKKFGLLLS